MHVIYITDKIDIRDTITHYNVTIASEYGLIFFRFVFRVYFVLECVGCRSDFGFNSNRIFEFWSILADSNVDRYMVGTKRECTKQSLGVGFLLFFIKNYLL